MVLCTVCQVRHNILSDNWIHWKKKNEINLITVITIALKSVVKYYPFGTDIFAPSSIACDNSKSSDSAAAVAALSASQISLRPSNAGAVSQNSSRFDRNCPSVNGTSDFQRIVSWQSGWFFLGGPLLLPMWLPSFDSQSN